MWTQIWRWSEMSCTNLVPQKLWQRNKTMKLHKFQYFCGTIKQTLLGKAYNERLLEFYKGLALPTMLHGSEHWLLLQRQKQWLKVAKCTFSATGYRLLQSIISNMTRVKHVSIYTYNWWLPRKMAWMIHEFEITPHGLFPLYDDDDDTSHFPLCYKHFPWHTAYTNTHLYSAFFFK
jgi:hypothetical protein